MKVHTLGPNATDSYKAAKTIVKDADIILHESFDEIIDNIEQYLNEYIIIPVAYTSHRKKYDWKDFNFQYCNRLKLCKVAALYTQPMLLLEKEISSNYDAIVHPATEIFLNKAKRIDSIEYAKSKYDAWKQFKNDYKYKYTLISKDVFEMEKNECCYNLTILEEYKPIMIWCLYKIL